MFVVLIEDVCRVLFDNDEKRVHDGRWWERWAEGRISWLGFSPGRRGSAVCVYVHVCLCWRLSRSVFVFVFMFILRLICELLHASINVGIDICSLTVDGAGDGVCADGVLGGGGGGNCVNVKIHKGW